VYGALESVAVLWRLRSYRDIIIIIIIIIIMVFSTDDHVLIKVLRQEKRHGATVFHFYLIFFFFGSCGRLRLITASFRGHVNIVSLLTYYLL